MVASYQGKNRTGLVNNATIFLDLLDDLDRVLATNANFMLGSWIESAKGMATNANEEALYEFNARDQLTLWGPDSWIVDYAAKQWSGLVSDYYKPRWTLFFTTLHDCLVNGSQFDQGNFTKTFLTEIGEPFRVSRTKFPNKPTEDTIHVVSYIHDKWRKTMNVKESQEDQAVPTITLF